MKLLVWITTILHEEVLTINAKQFNSTIIDINN